VIKKKLPYHKDIDPLCVFLDLAPERTFFVKLVLELPSAGPAAGRHAGKASSAVLPSPFQATPL
jgi:hypothetical protein